MAAPLKPDVPKIDLLEVKISLEEILADLRYPAK
jgi:hypothetical protein